MIRSLRTAALVVCVATLGACGDSTVLTGPQAEAAVTEAQARLERSGEVQFRGMGETDESRPVIFLDGARIDRDARSVLQDITPADIERIEVVKGCKAAGYAGANASSGMIRIFTKSFEGEVPEMEYDEERVFECMDRHTPTKLRWLHRAQQRHVGR